MKKNSLKIPGVKLLARVGVKPNHITILSLIIAITALYQPLMVGLGLFTVSFLLDLIDGNLARRHKLATPFGGVLDSVTDKVVEMLFIYYITIKFSMQTLGMLMIGLSILISYVKHRASMRTHSIFDRGERLTYLLIVSLFFNNFNQLILAFNIYNGLCVLAITQLMVVAYAS